MTNKNTNTYQLGIDIGSTTIKIALLDQTGTLVSSAYERHQAKPAALLVDMLQSLRHRFGDLSVSVKITGSIGMGLAETYALPFVQEVVAAAQAVRKRYPGIRSLVDIGGEDAKIIFFEQGEPAELRMNGNCAGGTGAFIDQMASLLDESVDRLNSLAADARQLHPIASRCGVFSKTDIQNLIAKNADKRDIAASIFHAVAVQTISTLAHGRDIQPPVLLCGGPLTFIPALREAFVRCLHLEPADLLLPENGTLLPAIGTALTSVPDTAPRSIDELIAVFEWPTAPARPQDSLPPLFPDADTLRTWQNRKARHHIVTGPLLPGEQEVFIGIDSGSTTTKIAVLDADRRLIFSFYRNNNGQPVQTVKAGLDELAARCEAAGARLRVKGSCSTGYGEDLVKTAFQLRTGIVETIAHYEAARFIDPDVSFILDIGGQDMKALFVHQGVIDRVEINEACSSGCGTFIETFAKTLGYSADAFDQGACRALYPCDLGTRCTVFMNSKVKQVLRAGATVEDVAAGLAYSVVKNCLYKVLKLKDTADLGTHIVVQGGTMRNDAVVRALEQLTGLEISRCDHPELMGAIGCALHAADRQPADEEPSIPLEQMTAQAQYETTASHCHGCENRCAVTCYRFGNGGRYYAGNRCERIFHNGEATRQRGANLYESKNELLFRRATLPATPDKPAIGIPRCLNMYEEYPFWHALFTACGLPIVLSDSSERLPYEDCARLVMSDNLCFPAKLVHSHIADLEAKRVDRIFMPFTVYEADDQAQNSYNCPIVTGYSEVIKSVQGRGLPIDSPVISFRDEPALRRQCRRYLKTLRVDRTTADRAFDLAIAALRQYRDQMVALNRDALRHARTENALVILLAGRPYHADRLIQHQLSEMLADMGICVLTDDIARGEREQTAGQTHFVAQWAFPNRIVQAAQWCAGQDARCQFVQMTSFGCGPDAFLTDSVRDLLMRHGKALTLLKLDDISNLGSIKLRVRSLVESLKLTTRPENAALTRPPKPFLSTPAYTDAYRGRTIIVPFFTPFISPMIPALMKLSGYEVATLPMSDRKSGEWGLRYANNEVCYPATLIIGDIIKTFKEKRFDPDRVVIAMTQTGGQCRATNYVPMIKQALVDAGYTDTPVVSLSWGDDLKNDQPAFSFDWKKVLPAALRAILYGDCLAKLYYATLVRETETGTAKRLLDHYMDLGIRAIESGESKRMTDYLAGAAQDFSQACSLKDCPKVGIVGEIFLKFNPFAHHFVMDWFCGQGVEVVPPVLSDFFLQFFINRRTQTDALLAGRNWTDLLYGTVYRRIRKLIGRFDSACAAFPYYTPFEDIFHKAGLVQDIVSLNAQFGEGWLLPAEIVSYRRQGVKDVICLQPFGCIANHIVARGIENRIKTAYPDINLLFLDFDSGVSEVNITNRMLLFLDKLKQNHHGNRNA